MAEYKDESYTVGNGLERITKHESRDVIWHRGYVVTPDGIVGLVSSEPIRTLFEFVHNGRCHYRRFGKQFQPRYLVTLAKQFAREITAKEAAHAHPD